MLSDAWPSEKACAKTAKWNRQELAASLKIKLWAVVECASIVELLRRLEPDPRPLQMNVSYGSQIKTSGSVCIVDTVDTVERNNDPHGRETGRLKQRVI